MWIEDRESSIQNQASSNQHQATSNEQPEPSDEPILLVVEDNADVRTYIRQYLEPAFKVIEAVDGVEGVQKALEAIPDLIITDVMMPKRDFENRREDQPCAHHHAHGQSGQRE
ncbi:hypothetical protein DCC62_13595 [candidate division KSB1 bacterium]|nr:MAG: hypothetical protein DCC62_13595 [candidate division KSB1 bacterium]